MDNSEMEKKKKKEKIIKFNYFKLILSDLILFNKWSFRHEQGVVFPSFLESIRVTIKGLMIQLLDSC